MRFPGRERHQAADDAAFLSRGVSYSTRFVALANGHALTVTNALNGTTCTSINIWLAVHITSSTGGPVFDPGIGLRNQFRLPARERGRAI